jgi:N-acetylmuramoyl-L-alanine amidase
MRGLTAATALATIIAPAFAASSDNGAKPVAVAARLAQDGNGARLIFDVSRPVEARAYALSSPDRIVVDLPEVVFELDPSVGRIGAMNDGALVRAFRFGPIAAGKSRIVIDLARPACPNQIASKPIVEGAPASRLVIELKPCEFSAFAGLEQAPPAAAAGSVQRELSIPSPVIVLDPGHGGPDGGAHGVGGTVEKTLVFEFCAELKRQLEATGKYTIAMTRQGDQYVDLDDRVAIAREANASLFISVHADSLSEAVEVGGSTVYTVADHASDAEAARVAAHENAADRQPRQEGGAQSDPQVADILFELKRRETRAYSHIFSRGLVGSLRAATRLNHNPERSAGFVVLKAPEFPSVLFELGYLSNAQDIQALTSADWRAKTAAAMVKAIDAFFAGPARTGGAATEAGVALGEGQTAAPNH